MPRLGKLHTDFDRIEWLTYQLQKDKHQLKAIHRGVNAPPQTHGLTCTGSSTSYDVRREADWLFVVASGHCLG